MSEPDRLTLGLAPALTLEETFQFGPLTLSPIGTSRDVDLRNVAAQYARERGAHPENQALIACPQNVRPLVPIIWPLFVFSCVTFARRSQHAARGVTFPENFHLLPITSTPNGLIVNSGHTLGIGGAEHVPLRWPVDSTATLREGWWDRSIELACTVLAKEPGTCAANAMAVAAGMAADLACAAMERRNQRVQNVAPEARTYVLLGTAFEALHCCGSLNKHAQSEVIKGIVRLAPPKTPLGTPVFSDAGGERPPKPIPGTAATRPMFVVAQILHLRNTYVHGRAPTETDYALPAELNCCHVMHAAMLILAALIGDDLAREFNCVVPGGMSKTIQFEERMELPSDLVSAALVDRGELRRCLADAINPASA